MSNPLSSTIKSRSPYRASAPALAILPTLAIAFFVLWPLVNILSRALSWAVISRLAHNPTIHQVLWFSTWQALASTIITLVVAFPSTYVLARFRFPGKRMLLALVTIPFVLPTVVVGAAFLALLPDSLHRSIVAILIAHTYFNIAVVVRIVGRRWEQISPLLNDAASTLGASPSKIFRTLTLPTLSTAIRSASAVIFLLCFTSYGIIRVLGGPARATLEVEIYSRAVQLGDFAGAAALSLFQLVILGLAMWWWIRSTRGSNDSARIQMHAVVPQTLRQRVVVYGISATTAIVIAAPLATVFIRSISTSSGVNLDAWRLVFGNHVTGLGTRPPLAAFWTSLQYAIATAVIAGVIGLAAAAAIAYGDRGTRLVEGLVMLPLATSAVTLGLGLLITFDSGITDLRSRWIMIPIAHSLVALPVVVRTMLPVIRSVPQGVRDASATLGASWWQMWLTIDRSLIARAWVTSLAFAGAISLGEFGASSFLTRRTSATLPTEIARLLGRPGDLVQAQAYVLASLLIIFIGVSLLAVDGLRPDRVAV
ncbi:MAG: iron ABC transporter permease [Ilumatobacteraceae bacterium]